jgi:sugar lactone lactonase YvrE
VRSFGGEGSEPGKLREPVGLAFSGNTLLVADTWNGRIQAFDPNGQPLAEYPVNAWPGQSVTNKPYLEVDDEGRMLISAPDQGTLLVLDRDGQQLASVQPAGQGGAPGSLPTGLALTSSGEVYVADSRLGFVYRLPVPR